jgi:NAD-dependent deacetylase
MEFENFAARLRNSREIVFFTGAGISTESGVPDFRSPGGVWTKYQPVYFDEFMSSEAARIRHWKLKKETHDLYKKVKPNSGHYAIREFEKRNQLLGLITQNIDGLHSLAGVSDEKIVELHGTDRSSGASTVKSLSSRIRFIRRSSATLNHRPAMFAAAF